MEMLDRQSVWVFDLFVFRLIDNPRSDRGVAVRNRKCNIIDLVSVTRPRRTRIDGHAYVASKQCLVEPDQGGAESRYRKAPKLGVAALSKSHGASRGPLFST